VNVVAYIPARGGSKRIPKKNIRLFHGTPALGHVIQIIESLPFRVNVFVSTDSEEIASVAESFGAIVINRDRKLADDKAGILEVIKTDLKLVRKQIPNVGVLACVLPTALLMSSTDLEYAIQKVESEQSQFIVSVGRFDYPIQRALRKDVDDKVSMSEPENYFVRSQDLEPMFHDAGQFYVGTPEQWESRATIFDPPPFAKLIESWRVRDIDVEEDWHTAERLWLIEADGERRRKL